MLKTVLELQSARSHRECGATAVQYGIMVAAIAVVVIAILYVVGGQVREVLGAFLEGFGVTND